MISLIYNSVAAGNFCYDRKSALSRYLRAAKPCPENEGMICLCLFLKDVP